MSWDHIFSVNPFINHQQAYPFFGYQYVNPLGYIQSPSFQQFGISMESTHHNYDSLGQPLGKPHLAKIEMTQDRTETNNEGKIEEQKTQKQATIFCQCNKSHCIKSYCLCYKNGSGCGEHCSCISCKNKLETSIWKRHQNKKKQIICNCSKSKCVKKYCECYAGGQKCGQNCRCTTCKN